MASTKTSRQKKAFIFFNCDEEKSETSMNLFYNKQIYNDTKKARTQLLEKLKSEQDAGKIQIDDLAAVEKLVMPASDVRRHRGFPDCLIHKDSAAS